MIPKLPPVILAAIAGAAIYGAKNVIDRFEPKAIGPPGSSNMQKNCSRIAAAVSGIVYASYWAYESRQHRSSPAVLTKNKTGDFYQDQYSERDRNYTLEKKRLNQLERERELEAQKHLEEVKSMEKNVLNNK
ncbi:unnamed protein product [Rhizopus stolonifer]